MSHSVRVSAILASRGENLGDGTWLEGRTIQATFFVPLNGQTTGWHYDNPIAMDITHLEFTGPNIELLLNDARNIARGELITELASKPLSEVAELLRALTDPENDPGWDDL